MNEKHITLRDGAETLYLTWESKKRLPVFRALFVFRANKDGAARVPESLTRFMMWRARRYCDNACVAPALSLVSA